MIQVNQENQSQTNLSLLRPPYVGEIHEMALFDFMQISNLNVQ